MRKDIFLCPLMKLAIKAVYRAAAKRTEVLGWNYEVDHVWPLSRGGTHTFLNLQVLTEEENLAKNDKLPWEVPELIRINDGVVL